jgi:hypothetical protein
MKNYLQLVFVLFIFFEAKAQDTLWVDVTNGRSGRIISADSLTISYNRSVLSAFFRPQSLLHTFPALIVGFELRPSQRIGFLFEYGYGLDYSIYNPNFHSKIRSARMRAAVHVYNGSMKHKGGHDFWGFEYFYFPLKYTSPSIAVENGGWFTYKNANIQANSWGFGVVTGILTNPEKSKFQQLEAGFGIKIRDRQILSYSTEIIEQEAVSNAFLQRIFKPTKESATLYVSFRINFGFKLWGKNSTYEFEKDCEDQDDDDKKERRRSSRSSNTDPVD